MVVKIHVAVLCVMTQCSVIVGCTDALCWNRSTGL
jgi:hypothetical protein